MEHSLAHLAHSARHVLPIKTACHACARRAARDWGSRSTHAGRMPRNAGASGTVQEDGRWRYRSVGLGCGRGPDPLLREDLVDALLRGIPVRRRGPPHVLQHDLARLPGARPHGQRDPPPAPERRRRACPGLPLRAVRLGRVTAGPAAGWPSPSPGTLACGTHGVTLTEGPCMRRAAPAPGGTVRHLWRPKTHAAQAAGAKPGGLPS